MTLTTETIKQWRSDAENIARRSCVYETEYSAAEAILALTAELLANREAQPVLYASEETLAYAKEGEKSLVTWSEPMGDAVIPLFTIPKAQTSGVVNLPTEFISDEGVVVRLEEVMSALAVVGVQCERKANAKTRCEFPAPAVPEEMTGGIAMSKHKVKKSNYAQWVKGWNACRAAMLAQPVSSGYTLNPPEIPDGWIACSERMPDDEQECLVQTHSGFRYVSFFDEHTGLFYDMPGGNQVAFVEHILVTHWMPLPAAPEGGNDHNTGR